ncbi:hypothetical protein H2200_005247 [Cladophialophora chaetospira]|uniref:Uncharacterized protein n=1 Tax=Cladophialophora chaetospira TaxID=386627 RepID=A0AA39CJF7_9EURO|nr:hypothetical protein H2200_005247 [Cladophialophora chaetospira]
MADEELPVPIFDLYDFDVRELVLGWATDHVRKIDAAYGQRGGWEKWAQVEIATMLADHISNLMASDANAPIHTVTREVPAYYVDIVISATDRNDSSRQDFLIVELKCESAQAKATTFAAGVDEDFAKISGDFKQQFQPAQLYAFAFTMSQDGYQKMAAEVRSWAKAASQVPGQRSSDGTGPAEAITNELALWSFEADDKGRGTKYDSLLAAYPEAAFL